MFSAWLCCSVGATWTVELRSADRGSGEAGPAGPVVDWICSGVPTELPAPDAEIGDVLADRGLHLFPDDLGEGASRTRSRRLIGHATWDPEVMRLALALAELLDDPHGPQDSAAAPHPMVLAAQWLDAGYSTDAALGWATAGISSPAAAQDLLSAELDRPEPLRLVPRQLVPSTRWGGQS